jgi:bifunctional non-homologous end joining protein LigD
LETIRQFAEEQLAASGAADTVCTAHARHFAGREADIMVALWDSPRQRAAYDWFARPAPGRQRHVRCPARQTHQWVLFSWPRTRTSRQHGTITTPPARFPELVASLQTVVDGHTVILDGEIVALGKEGRPDFGRLQRRLRVTRPVAGLCAAVPARYYLFDILHLDGVDLTVRPYAERRGALESLGLSREGAVVVPPCWRDLDGRVLLDVTKDLALEGVVCKRAESTYQAGRRSRSWVKTVVRRKARFIVIGWITGRTEPVGALLLAAHDPNGGLAY